jgi:hypothetical protein
VPDGVTTFEPIDAVDAPAPPAALPIDDDAPPPRINQRTLAAWRAELAKLREGERSRLRELPVETGRLLEIVGQALAQGGGPLPAADIALIEEITQVQVVYG